MAKFKIGDKVRVKTLKELVKIGESDCGDIQLSTDIFIMDGMSQYCGKIVKILEVVREDAYYIAEDPETWNFTDEMLEEV